MSEINERPENHEVEKPSEDKKKLLTVLLCAANNDDLESLMDFVEDNLSVE